MKNDVIKKTEDIIGYSFQNKEILKKAFTHTSFANERNMPSYERLEFLGDAVLSFVVATELYSRYPELDEGKLTKARAYLVSCGNLSKAIKTTSLMDFMLVGEGDIQNNMLSSQNMRCDLFESIVGAIFIDSKQSIDECKKFILRFLDKDITKAGTKESFKDHKSLLLELCAQKSQRVEFELKNKDKKIGDDFIFDILIDGKKVSQGQGKTKKEAQKLAAKNYFEALRKGR